MYISQHVTENTVRVQNKNQHLN